MGISDPLSFVKVWLSTACTLFLLGCATPDDVKQASQTQLQLMGELQQGIGNLSQALVAYNQEKQALILEEGIVLIGGQAIEDALARDSKPVTADQVFHVSQKSIQPVIGGSFQGGFIEAEIAAIDLQIMNESDEFIRNGLETKKIALESLRERLSFERSPAVAALEQEVLSSLAATSRGQEDIRQALDQLGLQVALMKELAEHVNRWLAIDVTITEEQATELRSALDTAFGSEGGGQ